MKWLRLLIVLVIISGVLLPVVVEADTSSDITISASGWVAGAPGGLTITYISDFEVQLSWTKGLDAVNTMIRAAYGWAPTSITDGYQIYNGPGTSVNDDSIALASPEVIYYTAFSQNAAGIWSVLYSSADTEEFMSASFLFIGLIMIACFLTYLCYKRPSLLVAFAAGLTWLGMAFWLLLGNVTNLALSSSWTQIIAWVFVIMTFVPFLLQMNQEIIHEAGGKRFTVYGPAPKVKIPTDYENYAKELRRRIRG